MIDSTHDPVLVEKVREYLFGIYAADVPDRRTDKQIDDECLDIVEEIESDFKGSFEAWFDHQKECLDFSW